MRGLLVLVTAFLGLVLTGEANADCANLPAPAKAYLESVPGWHIATLDGWDRDSAAEWRSYNKDACPGFTVANFDGTAPSYVLLLQRPAGGKTENKLIAIKSGRANFSITTLVPAYVGGGDFVIRVAPGKYQDHYDGRRYQLAHDGVSFGGWDASSSIYYLLNGRVKSFQNSI